MCLETCLNYHCLVLKFSPKLSLICTLISKCLLNCTPGEGPLAPLEDGVIEQLVEAVPIEICILALAPYGLRPGDAAPSGHTELVLYELPEVVDHVATQPPTVEVVEKPAIILLSNRSGFSLRCLPCAILPRRIRGISQKIGTAKLLSPIGLVQRRGWRTGHAHPSLTEIRGLLQAEADGT